MWNNLPGKNVTFGPFAWKSSRNVSGIGNERHCDILIKRPLSRTVNNGKSPSCRPTTGIKRGGIKAAEGVSGAVRESVDKCGQSGDNQERSISRRKAFTLSISFLWTINSSAAGGRFFAIRFREWPGPMRAAEALSLRDTSQTHPKYTCLRSRIRRANWRLGIETNLRVLDEIVAGLFACVGEIALLPSRRRRRALSFEYQHGGAAPPGTGVVHVGKSGKKTPLARVVQWKISLCCDSDETASVLCPF